MTVTRIARAYQTRHILAALLCALLLSAAPQIRSPAAAAKTTPKTAPKTTPHPPIPIHFTLKSPGYVTLVIDDARGMRVRNLISETTFPAGANTTWWDGLDDIGRLVINPNDNALAPKMVPPGTYQIRGLVRPKINIVYEMTPYTHGNPPWATADRGSEWLSNHTPPSAVLYVPDGPHRPGKPTSNGPQILVGGYVSEGGSGLAWLDLTGRKLWGQLWVGGVWTGAPYLARDDGLHPVPGVYAYTGSAWDDDLRLHELVPPERAQTLPIYPGQGGRRDVRFGSGEDPAVLSPDYKLPVKAVWNGKLNRPEGKPGLAGLAVHNGLLVASLPRSNSLLFVDARAHRTLGTATVSDPRGVCFDYDGQLLVLSGNRLLRYKLSDDPTRLPAPETLISRGLEDPQQIILDIRGAMFISDWGNSHQVKVFTADGKFVRAIGHPGVPGVGPYDPEHMNNPNGMTIDRDDRLWVAETNFQPKRISIWSLGGKLLNGFYGPPIYGGGGELDPHDKSTFYHQGMALKLNWNDGSSKPADILYRQHDDLLLRPDWAPLPQTPFYLKGHKYMTNCFNSNPTGGATYAVLWQVETNGLAREVAAIGRANDVPLFKTDAYRPRWPAGANLNGDWWGQNGANRTMFLWNDLNGDGKPQPAEVAMRHADSGGVTVMPDLSIVLSRVDTHPTGGAPSSQASAMRYVPVSFSTSGAPRYSLQHGKTLATGVQWPTTSGGDQALAAHDGWTILTTGAKPFASQSMSGAYKGKVVWQYPSLWPGLHASHNAPLPDHPGELIGTTRLLGNTVRPRGGQAGEIWAINGNKGNVYLFTSDGLFIATLFKDSRTAGWNMPAAKRGMLVNDYSLGEESFWPSITQIGDGTIYLTGNTSILRLDGLNGIQRIPAATINVTPQMLASAQSYFVQQEAARQAQQAAAQAPLEVILRATAPIVDGRLDDWASARFAPIDSRASAAIAIAGDHLYAAFKTDNDKLLTNSGQNLQNIFKTGGALDLMLNAIPGGERLLVTRVDGKTTAVLYRPHVPSTTTEPVKFISNIGSLKTVTMDRVDDVSNRVQLASDGKNYELSVPLSVLGINPRPGAVVKGDVGLLRGNGFQTLQRVYWHNKATGLVSDLASEAELTPQLWGNWEFKTAAP